MKPISYDPSFAWIEHNGAGRPVPIGTLVEARMFNGEVRRFTVGNATFGLDGAPIDRSRGRWSGWDYSDGGPMGPKFRYYRVLIESIARERSAAMFRSWLNVRLADSVTMADKLSAPAPIPSKSLEGIDR